MRKLVLVLGGIFVSAFSRQLTDEFKAWAPWLTKKLIFLGACVLPETEKERRVEEWAGHIDEVPGEMSKLIVALGFVAAGLWIRYDFRDRKRLVFEASKNAKNRVVLYVVLAGILVSLWLRRGLSWIGLSRSGLVATSQDNQAILALIIIGFVMLYQKSILSAGAIESPGA